MVNTATMHSKEESEHRVVCSSCLNCVWTCRCILPLSTAPTQHSKESRDVDEGTLCECTTPKRGSFPYNLPHGFHLLPLPHHHFCIRRNCESLAVVTCRVGKLCTPHTAEVIFKVCPIEAVRVVAKRCSMSEVQSGSKTTLSGRNSTGAC